MGCLPQKYYHNYKEKINKDCTPYYKYIKKNWEKTDDSVFIFNISPSYDSTLHTGYEHFNKPCIIGLSQKQVIKLFGKPSRIEDVTTYSVEKDSLNKNQFIPQIVTKFKYYRRKECFKETKHKIGCAQLTIVFDSKTEKVIGVSLPMVERRPIPGLKKGKRKQ